jgi:voltage-gated potassium channel
MRPRGETRRIVIFTAAIAAVLVAGTVGFMVIEKLTLVDAVYMTVISITTVGFGEVKPFSAAGRVFAIVVVVGGVSVLAYGLSSMLQFVVDGQLTGLYRRRSMKKRIESMHDHFIICGHGRVGEAVAKEFALARADFVVVDRNAEVVERVLREGHLAIEGDASDDEVLMQLGVDRAQGLVAVLDSDASNTFVVLSARVLNPRLVVVARANSEHAAGKLRRAGADQVISPYAISGRKMAHLLLRPLVSDYLDVMTGEGEIEFRLEEFALNGTCEVVGRSILDLDIRRRTGASILAVRRTGGNFDTNPSAELVLAETDTLIAIGTPEEMGRLEELFACRVPIGGSAGRGGDERSPATEAAPPDEPARGGSET